ncbi:energy-coupling factor transport system permease protein [Rhizobium sp. PP-F2F-G38]|uniref:energy-coupling factor transporter transmembrane component T family protein n=1 Tax=Rhizobium sp. PP-CC-3G-465 TaxID=2135648 RepID=UPI000D81E7BD|nr:energy-coupling factor transport system permease protein [Rhizobium sp. PP-F2F-G38]TCP77997.1 energy-coupling factor transport system permease protein [Rhizobium sp. PP-CC-2G-626]TCQ25810.1 energy-coupling factor transport system permease protein [Rhizobium sp. PP-CC-3G-465]
MNRLHEINFFIKLAFAFSVMLVAWLVPGWRFGLPFAVLTVAFLWLAGVPGLRGYIKGALLLSGMVVVSWLVNLWLQGATTAEALPIAAGMAARLVTTTAAFFFVMETSTPGSILAASSAARLPPVVTLVLSLTFGIIPMLRDDFERIADAQRARGMEIDDVSLPTKLRFALARGIPLLVQAIRMAHAISFSLSIYGFDLKQKRTTWRIVGPMVEPRMNMKDKADDN